MKVGGVDQRTGDGDPLTLASGKLCRAVVEAVRQMDFPGHLGGDFPTDMSVDARVDHWHLDIFLNGQMGRRG